MTGVGRNTNREFTGCDTDNYREPEDLDNLFSIEDDTTHGGFHV
ncbi:hypothetical protein Tco_0709457, partial [Tanacetum coccineum]